MAAVVVAVDKTRSAEGVFETVSREMLIEAISEARHV